jgi:hypothetical protein
MASSKGRSVRLFLVDGTPTGLVTAEVMNWTGHALVLPRSSLGEALKRDEASRTGIYFLVGDDPKQPSKSLVYVGEGDNVGSRLASHVRDSDKEFWTKACVVTSKDQNLTKAHVRFLESRLIEKIKIAGRANIANGTEPEAKGLPESDVADMEFFLDQIDVILPVAGFDFLRPQPIVTSGVVTGDDAAAVEIFLVSENANVKASAIYQDGEVTVLANSHASTKTYAVNLYSGLRQQLIDEGRLTLDSSTDRMSFGENVSFSSPSAASSVVLNRNSNGRTEWKLTDGRTLKDWQDRQLEDASSA